MNERMEKKEKKAHLQAVKNQPLAVADSAPSTASQPINAPTQMGRCAQKFILPGGRSFSMANIGIFFFLPPTSFLFPLSNNSFTFLYCFPPLSPFISSPAEVTDETHAGSCSLLMLR